MALRKSVLVSSLASAAIAVAGQPAAAAPWSRGFVVSTYGFAFHYAAGRAPRRAIRERIAPMAMRFIFWMNRACGRCWNNNPGAASWR